ncbi:type ISP restriction/modification enzyme [Aerosakkonema funiforme]|uniref:site-specific DNA-methyltransferase (adenine-specific) n=1 Tax=Aerosakkonema funiforme FACHB-1375 TaxID=2949571 RepID=A0A926VL77_9CYAN|nr:type ISP restriction/modification enzyme [Aerosakkonema funiforme]MBD2185851.1 N-6 DNA methylase [Aerosakkonema funiforme FACHB-1375]
MTTNAENNFTKVLQKFATEVTNKFRLQSISFNPEDQLKAPIENLLKRCGEILNLKVNVVTEVREKALSGRPDVGVAVSSLLAGYIELKAPGKGADPSKFKGDNKQQWEKFKNLSNLIYTDGNQWALYRTGERVGKIIKLSGDITSDGEDAVTDRNSQALLTLLRDFFQWKPIVPSTPKALAEMLAPICRLLRTDVLAALEDPESNLSNLAKDWRIYLFPDADNKQFADAYAQTLTYALLLARFSGAEDLSLPQAVKTIRTGHSLLADALKILGDEAAREQIEVSLNLLERIIAAIDITALAQKGNEDPWLYFYEDFLAQYDPKMRKERGVYYTPVPVIQTQVRLVAELLEKYFDAEYSFIDPKVVTLDPACGTGTYILTALKDGFDRITKDRGAGMRVAAATTAAANIHAFEILVGPYAVAHLRLTQQILSEGGTLPKDGVHVYLTDTLESPYAAVPGHLPLSLKPLGEEYKRAQKIKQDTPVLVCIGNPPYDRQQIQEDDREVEKRKGGWVRFGDNRQEIDRNQQMIAEAILQDFIEPLRQAGQLVHAKNLYNDYVYFWRWALWKVFESNQENRPGIISFITASSYLRGPGFAGMRQVMRQTFDELWFIDLEGDNLGARKTDNVFAIQTPVAIAIGVRYGKPQPEVPAKVHFTRVDGTEGEKLATLGRIDYFKDLVWKNCPTGWTDLFLPVSDTDYGKWARLTDLFPWQVGGVQFKRKWPIGESIEILKQRWKNLISARDSHLKAKLFKETRDRKISKQYRSLEENGILLPPIVNVSPDTSYVQPIRYAYRSFDRQWALLDNRLCDFARPVLFRSYSDRQVYMISLLTNVLGEGSSAVATALIADLDHFRGSFGGKHIIPLWRDAAGTQPNITHGVLATLIANLKCEVLPEDFFAYCYAILATPKYVKEFWNELETPGARIPITKDSNLFGQVVAIGRQLVWLHTYGERFIPNGMKPGKIPPGKARCKIGTPTTETDYPTEFSYDVGMQELRVGKGIFEGVRQEVYNFSISGLEVVTSWLSYRMKDGAGKKSSPLDDIRPQIWEFDNELLDLLWVLDATVDIFPQLSSLFDALLKSNLFVYSEFRQPTESERVSLAEVETELPLFNMEKYEEEEE